MTGSRSLAAEDDYVDAELRRDEAALRRLVDERFVGNRADGTTFDREGLIRAVIGMNMISQALTERTALVEGAVGFVYGTARLTFGGGDEPERVSLLRYTSIYVNRGGSWRMLGLRMSPRSSPTP